MQPWCPGNCTSWKQTNKLTNKNKTTTKKKQNKTKQKTNNNTKTTTTLFTPTNTHWRCGAWFYQFIYQLCQIQQLLNGTKRPEDNSQCNTKVFVSIKENWKSVNIVTMLLSFVSILGWALRVIRWRFDFTPVCTAAAPLGLCSVLSLPPGAIESCCCCRTKSQGTSVMWQ